MENLNLRGEGEWKKKVYFRLQSHRSILYTVFAIHYTICSPPQTTFKGKRKCTLGCNHIEVYCTVYTVFAMRFALRHRGHSRDVV